MRVYTIKGQPIHVDEQGSPNNQVALLIHGWSSSSYALSSLMPLLSRRFACKAVDLPGYGESPPPNARATIEGYADLLADLIGAVSSGPVVLVGHSMGGMISLTLALRHPMLVERMVLLCPTISGHLSNFINMFISPITVLERFGLAGRVVAAIEPHFLNITDNLMRPASFAERTAITEEDYKRLRADARRPGQGRVRAECYYAMRAGDLRGRLGAVEAPSLVLWGAEDNTVPLRDAGVVADEWPHADLRIIPKAGHWPQFEAPAATHRHIAAFLGLPLITTRLNDASEQEVTRVDQVARFLAHSDVGNGMNLAQRTRLAAQCHMQTYAPHACIAQADTPGNQLYITQEGSVEVWNVVTEARPEAPPSQPVATLLPGQITGELALLDGGRRSADLRAGPEGATLLTLSRERLVALCEDDPALGNRLLWNIASALGLRLRLTQWKQQRQTAQQPDDDGVAV